MSDPTPKKKRKAPRKRPAPRDGVSETLKGIQAAAGAVAGAYELLAPHVKKLIGKKK